ncbi:MAG: hypothetical protein LBO70_02625 [Clostridiales Family XIII bacterium]|nr:hypothetical protein [Clostridiales Family XIII bacterium]
MIVVLVILAILAAIAIPVLTGYIDKAREKEYIAEARNRFVAMKAICNEAYANGDLATWLGGSLDQVYNGINPDNYNGFKIFAPKTYTVEAKIDELLGNPTYPGGSDAGHWVLFPLGAKAPETTLFNADGFQYSVRLDPASVTNRRTVMITYKVDRVEDGGSEVEMNTRLNNGVYNPNAGYEVYYTDH